MSARTSFEAFVVGPENERAYGLARRFAEEDTSSPGLLLLHGAEACGKSHLLQAIAQRIAQIDSVSPVRCVSAVKFGNEFCGTDPERLAPSLRKFYERFDMLLFDDLQALGPARAVHEEFGVVCGALLRRGGRVCLASKRPDLTASDSERLAEFYGARVVTAELRPPSLESRLAIIDAATERRGCRFAPAALALFARQENWNIHRLLIMTLCLGHIARSTGCEVDLPMAERYARKHEG
jgi:chromosomal replication initiator protein